MNTLISTIVAGFLLFVSHSSVSAQSVLQAVAPEQLHKIVKDEGYAVEPDKDNDLIWKIEGTKCLLMTSDSKGSTIVFRTSFRTKKVTLEAINEWNKSKRYSRSYLDKDGEPVLQLDLDLAGGITKDRILDFLSTCKASLNAWIKEVIQR